MKSVIIGVCAAIAAGGIIGGAFLLMYGIVDETATQLPCIFESVVGDSVTYSISCNPGRYATTNSNCRFWVVTGLATVFLTVPNIQIQVDGTVCGVYNTPQGVPTCDVNYFGPQNTTAFCYLTSQGNYLIYPTSQNYTNVAVGWLVGGCFIVAIGVAALIVGVVFTVKLFKEKNWFGC